MTVVAPGIDIDGPVQAEVFVVWLAGDRLELSGPCGANPWLIELGRDDHPLEVVVRVVGDTLGRPRLVHSTSWRRDRGAVILTFVAAVDPSLVDGLQSAPVERTDLARSGAVTPPAEIGHGQVLEHALRHLAWLASDDPVVGDTLTPDWRAALRRYAPEPFRNLGG